MEQITNIVALVENLNLKLAANMAAKTSQLQKQMTSRFQ